MRGLAPLAAALALVACAPEEGPLMAPGEDCLGCHSGGEAPAWSFAGTIFARPEASASEGVQGITITVEDANGKRVSVRSNEAGNFYSAERLVLPLRTWVSHGEVVVPMEGEVEFGSCNVCHTYPAAPGFPELRRLVAP